MVARSLSIMLVRETVTARIPHERRLPWIDVSTAHATCTATKPARHQLRQEVCTLRALGRPNKLAR